MTWYCVLYVAVNDQIINDHTACTFASHVKKSLGYLKAVAQSPPFLSSSRFLPAPFSLPLPFFLSRSPIVHSASRPVIMWESIGKLSLLPVFLPHQQQVAWYPPPANTHPPRGKEVWWCVCVRERTTYRWEGGHTSWVADSEQIKTRLCSFILENDSSCRFPKMWGW